jgi:hypothetical protein
MIVNKLQAFLTENFELVQEIEPGDHGTIDGGMPFGTIFAPHFPPFTSTLPTFPVPEPVPPFGTR